MKTTNGMSRSSVRIVYLLLFLAALAVFTVGTGLRSAYAATGDLYALGNTTGNGGAAMELHMLDKTNASSTLVASTGTIGLRGLAIDPTTGTFYSAYGAPTVTTKRGIVEINPVTGAVTDIGGTKAIVTLAFDSSGQLYGAENAGQGEGNVYKISTSDGSETLLGTAACCGAYGPGLAYDSSTSTLYLNNWEGQLSTIDTTNGVDTYVGTVTFPWYASHSFDFDENGNVYYHQHPCGNCGDGLAFADSSDIFNPTNLGFTGVRVWGLAYQWSANEPPTAAAGGPYLVAVGNDVAFDGSGSSDPDGDTLAETWTADGGTVASNVYTAGTVPGIYDVQLIVNDGTENSQPATTIVVVYDPSAGFVTGGGWIDSPAGAYKDDETLKGKANFGFVAKYRKGANVPDGNTQFQFKAGDLNFHSSSYEWLVVAGNKAQFKGEGTINGEGSYMFKIWADDDNPDTFRIHIWGDTGTVYDNGSQQALGGGSIKVHQTK